eukprot:gnl/MRDRNA2_/MRDRNA2_97123_c0_seq1.p1 gnl/MRDRNA2_/MRDRNA2_97123_c0~~gnl/MRDRNA2_/MRDRNA2_97123_c0_seq1.p1  ORF type:complete len:467 (+),score=85.40 gnl/MRDRNA2_/MRDRNA2_97123_c0_seq1:73-1401(+)
MDEAEEVPRCHLHSRKPNKACKFCKAYIACTERKQKQEEDRKAAVIEKLKKETSMQGRAASASDPIPIPNVTTFPNVLKERILILKLFQVNLSNQSFDSVLTFLADNCDTVELDIRNGMDVEPSAFISSLYRLMTIKLTEGQLNEMMESQSCWVRCASFLYIRLFCHTDRYWDLLSDSLIDDEEFVPFPKDGKEMESITVGEYVEMLLSQDKYCEITLPRVTAAQRKMITERLCLYGQFRKRYLQNLEVLDRFDRPEGVDVEVCRADDGEWFAAKSAGSRSLGSRHVTVPVFNPTTQQVEHFSISRVICTDREPRDSKDLTRSRGVSNKELLDRCREQQRSSAMATGKNYNKSMFRHQVRIGGVAITVGAGATHEQPKRSERSEYESDEEERAMKKRKKELHEAEAKRAEIEAKYLAGASAAKSKSSGGVGDWEGSERMRLG